MSLALSVASTVFWTSLGTLLALAAVFLLTAALAATCRFLGDLLRRLGG